MEVNPGDVVRFFFEQTFSEEQPKYENKYADQALSASFQIAETVQKDLPYVQEALPELSKLSKTILESGKASFSCTIGKQPAEIHLFDQHLQVSHLTLSYQDLHISSNGKFLQLNDADWPLLEFKDDNSEKLWHAFVMEKIPSKNRDQILPCTIFYFRQMEKEKSKLLHLSGERVILHDPRSNYALLKNEFPKWIRWFVKSAKKNESKPEFFECAKITNFALLPGDDKEAPIPGEAGIFVAKPFRIDTGKQILTIGNEQIPFSNLQTIDLTRTHIFINHSNKQIARVRLKGNEFEAFLKICRQLFPGRIQVRPLRK